MWCFNLKTKVIIFNQLTDFLFMISISNKKYYQLFNEVSIEFFNFKGQSLHQFIIGIWIDNKIQ